MNPIRILLVDDHRILRDGLRALIEAQPNLEVVGEASDGLTALRMVEEVRPDVVVMDFTLPGISGIEATGKLKISHPGVKVLALTVHEEPGYLRRFLDAGASGYALKQAPAVELFRAIMIVASGGTYIEPALAGRVISHLDRQAKSVHVDVDKLSERETEVVRLIAQGYSNKEVAARLAINAKTVETYKARSLDKLQLRSRADLVRYALQKGWLQ